MHRSLHQNIAAFPGSIFLMIVLLMSTGMSLFSASAQDGKVIATLNSQKITEEDLTFAEKQLTPQFGKLPEEEKRAAVLSTLIDLHLLSDEAIKQKLDKTEEFAKQQTFMRDQALHSAYIDRNFVKDITDDEIRARYDSELAKVTMPEEIHARHILVESEDKAKAIIEQLEKGEDFITLAKEKSTDGVAASGGDLGYFTKGRMVPEFEAAAFAIEQGSYGKEPVQTQFGWHIIKVEDKRQQAPPALEQVKDQIRSLIVREKYIKTLGALRDKAKVVIPDEKLKASVDDIYLRQSSSGDDKAD